MNYGSMIIKIHLNWIYHLEQNIKGFIYKFHTGFVYASTGTNSTGRKSETNCYKLIFLFVWTHLQKVMSVGFGVFFVLFPMALQLSVGRHQIPFLIRPAEEKYSIKIYKFS